MRSRLEWIVAMLLVSVLLTSCVRSGESDDSSGDESSAGSQLELAGEWTLLLPVDEHVLEAPEPPQRYSDVFQVFGLDFRGNGTVVMTVGQTGTPERHTWVHSPSTSVFRIMMTETTTIGFAYFDGRGFVPDDPAIDTWTGMQSASQTGLIEFERVVLEQLASAEGETPEIAERIQEIEQTVDPISRSTIPVIMSTIENDEILGGVLGILTRRDIAP